MYHYDHHLFPNISTSLAEYCRPRLLLLARLDSLNDLLRRCAGSLGNARCMEVVDNIFVIEGLRRDNWLESSNILSRMASFIARTVSFLSSAFLNALFTVYIKKKKIHNTEAFSSACRKMIYLLDKRYNVSCCPFPPLGLDTSTNSQAQNKSTMKYFFVTLRLDRLSQVGLVSGRLSFIISSALPLSHHELSRSVNDDIGNNVLKLISSDTFKDALED